MKVLFTARFKQSGVDRFAAACELGVQKPDPGMFLAATRALDVEPPDAVMVGDTVRTDGGAAAVGIATLILPRLAELRPRDLDVVLRLLARTTPRAYVNRSTRELVRIGGAPLSPCRHFLN